MSPEVLRRKLTLLIGYLEDLKRFEKVSYQEFLAHHYTVERLLQLLNEVARDIVFHRLALEEIEPPGSYQEVFLKAGEQKLLSSGLSKKLAEASRMRNILVHLYEKIDSKTVYAAVPKALRDYTEFVRQMKKK